MTVAELIKILKKHPQDIKVAYQLYSEQCLLTEKDMKVRTGGCKIIDLIWSLKSICCYQGIKRNASS